MKTCEEILMQKAALLDGEATELAPEEISRHLETCVDCRAESAAMERLILFLGKQERRAASADLWSALEKRVDCRTNWQPLALLGAFLVVYKLVELLPARDLGFALKIVPIVLIAAAFAFLKENPFKINTQLIVEK